MGTALTESQVRELGRLTKRLFLCFDSDAAGQEATLRGMELAVRQGFDVRVVALPKGEDADAPDTFAARLGSAELPPLPRAITLERTADRQRLSCGPRDPRSVEDSPERQEALRLLADRLDLPRETLAGLAPPTTRSVAGAPVAATHRLLEAGLQRERDLLAAVVRHPSLVPELAALTPDHFDDPLHRRFREVLVSGAPEDEELVALRAELGARADRDELDERAGRSFCSGAREAAPPRAPGRRPGARHRAPGAAGEGAQRPRRARVNLYARVVGELGRTRAFSWIASRALPPVDARFSRRRRSLTSLGSGFPLCFLTTVGRRTGELRAVPLLHVADGQTVVLIASNWGRRTHPGWALNLEATDAHGSRSTESSVGIARGARRPRNAAATGHRHFASGPATTTTASERGERSASSSSSRSPE